MAKPESIREYCTNLENSRREGLKGALNRYFDQVFIRYNKPFRAIIGNKKCRPIPIHRDFVNLYGSNNPRIESNMGWKFYWPNLSETIIRDELQNLGFIVTDKYICIAVPKWSRNSKLTYAQEWAKKINENYMKYCNQEAFNARKIYSEFIKKLKEYDTSNVINFEEYTLFERFEFELKTGHKCCCLFRKKLKNEKIIEYYEKGRYKGIKVLNS